MGHPTTLCMNGTGGEDQWTRGLVDPRTSAAEPTANTHASIASRK